MIKKKKKDPGVRDEWVRACVYIARLALSLVNRILDAKSYKQPAWATSLKMDAVLTIRGLHKQI